MGGSDERCASEGWCVIGGGPLESDGSERRGVAANVWFSYA